MHKLKVCNFFYVGCNKDTSICYAIKDQGEYAELNLITFY